MNENQNRPKTPLLMVVDDTARTISLPKITNPSDQNYERVYRDINRIQWMSQGHGGKEENGMFVFSFNQEEYNCSLRYLREFEWKDRCDTCTGTGEK